MNILLVAATEAEVRKVISRMAQPEPKSNVLTSYRYFGHRVDVLITGIGMMMTAFHMGRQLSAVQYDLALNAGIAGTYGDKFHIGDVVEVTEEMIPETGAEVESRIISAFELGLMDPDEPPFREGRIVNQRSYRLPVIDLLPKARGNTVSTIRSTAESIRWLQEAGSDVESMEGAAFLYACLSAGVHCAEIRAISNRVEERDKSLWDIPLALKGLNRTLTELLKVPGHLPDNAIFGS